MSIVKETLLLHASLFIVLIESPVFIYFYAGTLLIHVTAPCTSLIRIPLIFRKILSESFKKAVDVVSQMRLRTSLDSTEVSYNTLEIEIK